MLFSDHRLNPSSPIVDTVTPSRALRERFITWATRRFGVARHEIRLQHRRLFILPTRHGYGYALMLLLMLLAAINDNNSMAFLLTFTLAGLGGSAMWRTHRNLMDLTVSAQGADAAFAGGQACFRLRIHNPSRMLRPAIALSRLPHACTLVTIPAGASTSVVIRIPAAKRGVLRAGRLVISTRYPLGLFRAWSWLEFDLSTVVYPRPAKDAAAPPEGGGTQTGARAGPGQDDYEGLRDYRGGDPPRHIAWKAFAHTGTLLTKQFCGDPNTAVWLDWDDLDTPDTERRLSLLCAWVLQAARQARPYGLRLPGQTLGPEAGPLHQRRCLEALARYAPCG
jgi:uncharacterized protein (DUF58 family)